jgi:hypothetical protein
MALRNNNTLQGTLEAGRTAKGAFVATSSLANRVYVDAANNYSVCGYAERMEESFGLIYLGLDDGPDYQRQASAINAAIRQISEADAFTLAYDAARALPRADKSDISQASVAVLAAVSRAWFDLPDGVYMKPGAAGLGSLSGPARCPGDFAAPSGHIFTPDPPWPLPLIGKMLGKKLRRKVGEFVTDRRSNPSTLSGSLSTVIFGALRNESDDLVARTLVGVMMGFLPTVDENIKKVVKAWRKDDTFANLQARYTASPQTPPFARARGVLLAPLVAAIQDDPVPSAIWRTATCSHMVGDTVLVQVDQDERVEVRIAEATRADKANGVSDLFPVFGGNRNQSPSPTHGCPGYNAAVGVMLGLVAGLMD